MTFKSRFSSFARSSFATLKVRLSLASIIVVGASVALTTVGVLREVSQRTQRIVLDSLEDDARRFATVLAGRVIDLQLALRRGAAQIPVTSVLDADRMTEFLDRQPVLTGMFSGVFVAAPNGQVIVMTDAGTAKKTSISVADRPYFQKVLSQRRSIVSEAVTGRLTKEAMVVFAHPVFDQSGRLAAVLGGTLNLAGRGLMNDLTNSGDASTAQVLTIVIDLDGKIISHPSEEWLLRDGAAEPNVREAVVKWVEQGRAIEPSGTGIRAGDSVAGFAGVPVADWVVFRTARADALLGGILQAERRARWLGTAVAVGGGLVTLVLTAVMLRPLRRLRRRAARLLVDGADVEHDWPRADGELGELSTVFQHVLRQRAQGQRANELLLAKMQALMSNAPLGFAIMRDGRFELASAQFNRLFGYAETELHGQPAFMISTLRDASQDFRDRVTAAFTRGEAFEGEVECFRKDGCSFWGRLHGAPVSEGDLSLGTIWIVEDVTLARAQRERLSWTATHDALTDLVNRKEFEARLNEQLELLKREGERSAALFIDLDRFKAVNDTAGHGAGDQVLRGISKILLERVRAGDTVARLGGDEFAVLLRGCDLPMALGLAEQIRLQITEYALAWQGQLLQVGASIGVVEIDVSLPDVAAVIAAADAACYAAKRAGRNAVHSHVPSAQGGDGVASEHRR